MYNNYELKRIDVNQTAIFNNGEDQEAVYQGLGSHFISQLINGSNMSMIFYGKSTAGKSYTAGLSSGSFSSDPRTLIPSDGIAKRLLHDAFSRAKSFGNHCFLFPLND